MSDRYISETSEDEVKYLLTAVERLKLRLRDNGELCSHSHEINFLNQHNSLIRKRGEKLNLYIPLVNSLFRNLMDIAINEPHLENLIKQFWNCSNRNLSKSEMLLSCFSLLVNYHKKNECSEYLTLALKFKLVAYMNFVGHSFYAVTSSVMMIMVEFLRYISRYKCKHILFIAFIDVFYEYYDRGGEDYLLPVLSQVLDAAHELHFNFFRLWDKKFILMGHKYVQKSMLENLKRYLILTKYGYEDQIYNRAFFCYHVYITICDTDNLFGFKRRVIRRRSNKKYRPYQVLFLYIQSYYCYYTYGEELYDEVLRVLWKSIPDSFLTQKQFLSAFEQSDEFPEFLKAWKWYAKVVLNGVESENNKTPRSLKQLTRCAIRRVLTESVQLPFGIKSLNIPSTVKSYLYLETDSTI